MVKYKEVLDELQAEGIDYIPLAWSCWGRPHEDASAAIRSMAAAAARRRGDLRPDAIARRTATLVGLQIAKRSARMVDACLPSGPCVDMCEALSAAVHDARAAAAQQRGRGRSRSDAGSDSEESIRAAGWSWGASQPGSEPAGGVTP